MTEAEAIAACQKLAERHGRELGSNVLAILIEDSSFDILKRSPREQLQGNWMVTFYLPSSFQRERFFVNDATGKVSWTTGPVSWWLWLLLLPLYLFWIVVIVLGSVIALPCARAWKYFWLPRCPHCWRKLRTPLAKQCFSCGKDWH